MLKNPYDVFIDNKNKEITSIEIEANEINDILILLKQHTFDALLLKLSHLSERSIYLSGQWDQQKVVFDHAKAEVKSIEQKIDSQNFISKLFHSSDNTKTLEQAKSRLVVTYRELNKLNDALQSKLDEKKALSLKIDRIRSDGEGELTNRLSAMVNIQNRLKEEILALSDKKAKIDQLIAPFQYELKSSQKTIDQLHQQITHLECLENELDQANTGFERKQIHQTCEEEYGNGNPSRVKSQILAQLKSEKFQRAKIESRGKKTIKIAMNDVKCLVIDGNNCCYEGSQFIGLNALLSLSKYLVRHHYQVIIVFDASIRKLLQMNDQDIRHQFAQVMDLNANIIHIVPTRSKADGIILEVADDESSRFVISNDKFKDFPEKAVVREDRIIKHNIIAQKVIIEDLQISINFQS